MIRGKVMIIAEQLNYYLANYGPLIILSFVQG
jgi:hypothetical protein